MQATILLTYTETLPAALFEEFVSETEHRDAIEVHSHPPLGPFAGVEWLVPTAVVLFITKAYFEAFLKEAGKDHYLAFKKATAKLAARLSKAKNDSHRHAGKASYDANLLFHVLFLE